MKVLIYATNRTDLMKNYPLLKGYENFYDSTNKLNYIIKEMDDNELMKVINMLSKEDDLVVGYDSKYDEFSIEIYNDWRE
jgi:hypothetical protein